MTTQDPTRMSDEELRAAVRDRYATSALSLLDAEPASCCGPADCDPITRDLYGTEGADVPQAALTASLGCGNPTELAELEPGQVVLDLGSGGGLDVLLAAQRVAPHGFVYGLDMTPEMLALARKNQAQSDITNADFLQGTMEDVPLPDASVDWVISNCVINLAADKERVLREAHRVLRPGGSFAVADMVVLRPLPRTAQRVMALWTGCISGALRDTDYRAKLGAAGFVDVEIRVTRTLAAADLRDLAEQLPADLSEEETHAVIAHLDGAIGSAFVHARKP